MYHTSRFSGTSVSSASAAASACENWRFSSSPLILRTSVSMRDFGGLTTAAAIDTLDYAVFGFSRLQNLTAPAAAPQPCRKAGGAQRCPHGILQQLDDHRRPGAAAELRAALDEGLFHEAGEPQRHAEATSELECKARIFTGQIHRKTDVIASIEDDLALSLMDEAIAGACGYGIERRAQVHSALCAEHQRLPGGDQMNERQHIGDHLRDCGLFDAAQINDPPAHGLQCRPMLIEHRLRTAHQNGDIAGLCAVDTARDRAGEGGNAQLAGACGEGLDR